MIVGILALQGAYKEHAQMFQQLNVETFEIKNKKDINKHFDAIVLPGGESTVIGQLLRENDMFDILKEKISKGLPTLATCAGLILLANHITNDTNTYLDIVPMTVKRNAYGRQIDSFVTNIDIKYIGNVEARFIRAPYIETVNKDVDVLATFNNHIIAIKYKSILALTFHPELTSNLSIHKYFISMIQNK